MLEILRKKPSIVCSAFIERKGKYLMIFCPRFHLWRVPGGRAELGELLEQVLKREVKEETGLSLSKIKFLGYGQDKHFDYIVDEMKYRILMFFSARAVGKLRLSKREAEAYKWVTIDELKKIKNKEGALNDFFKKNPKIVI